MLKFIKNFIGIIEFKENRLGYGYIYKLGGYSEIFCSIIVIMFVEDFNILKIENFVLIL